MGIDRSGNRGAGLTHLRDDLGENPRAAERGKGDGSPGDENAAIFSAATDQAEVKISAFRQARDGGVDGDRSLSSADFGRIGGHAGSLAAVFTGLS